MNRSTLSAFVALATALAACAQTAPADLKGKTLAETFGKVLPGLGATDDRTRTAAQQAWQDVCFRAGAPGNERLRAEACALMTAKLNPKAPVATLWLLAQLERLGRDESVDALAVLLDERDEQIREAAVRALTNNPSPRATSTLVKQLATASGTAKVGLLNALGYRGDVAAVGLVARELNGERDAAIAAARALGRIAGPAALKELTAARGNAKGPIRAALADALLANADRMAAARDIGNAAAIYKLLSDPSESQAVRLAALRGTIQVSGDKAGATILELLAGDDAGARAIAVGQIETLSGDAMKSLASGLDKLPPARRVLALTAIAARGDRSQRLVALAAARSSDPAVRRAGLLALGRLGDASVVEFLLESMSGNDAHAGVAAESLARLSAEGVDEKLVAVLAKEKASANAAALIGILERRKAAGAIPTLLASAGGPDATVRAASFAALKSLASPEHVRGMVAALLKTQAGKERDQAELAIAAVCKQAAKPENRAEPVLAAIGDAKQHTKDLLPLLGRIGGPDSLRLFRDALAASDPSLRTAAFAGLCHWPDATANDELFALAEKEPADRVRALQALIRINTVPGQRSPEERLASLIAMKKAMPLATRDDERRAILEGLGNVRHIETLRFVLPYMNRPTLEQSACKGVVELAHSRSLREPNKQEFAAALDRVMAVCKDRALVERAKQYKDGR